MDKDILEAAIEELRVFERTSQKVSKKLISEVERLREMDKGRVHVLNLGRVKIESLTKELEASKDREKQNEEACDIRKKQADRFYAELEAVKKENAELREKLGKEYFCQKCWNKNRIEQ